MNKGGGIYFLIGLLLIFLIIDAGLATRLLTPSLTRSYVVQPGETLADIADKFKVHEQVIVQKNRLRPGSPVQSGQVLWIPMSPLGPLLQWELQLVGIAGTLVGVLVSFWLSNLSGLLPKDANVAIMGSSLAVAIIHYAVIQVSGSEMPAVITPLFALNSVKDGFAWSTVLLLLSRALGFGRASTSG